MKLLSIITISLVVFVVYGRPTHIGTETAPEAELILSRSFEKKDYQHLNLPPIQSYKDKTVDHPFNYNLTNDGSGNYYFGYNVIGESQRYEIGELKNSGTENEIQTVRGQYIDIYSIMEGRVIRIIGYTADENGYRPFLIDIYFEPDYVHRKSEILTPPGGPKGQKSISSSAQASLLGGGLGK